MTSNSHLQDSDNDRLGCTADHRTWFHEMLPGPPGGGDVIVIMKNPSWPDEGNICLAEARRMAEDFGFSNLYVGNLFGRRARQPGQLNSLTYEDAVIDENDRMLELMAAETDLLVAAWGSANGIDKEWYQRRVNEVVDLLGPDRFTCFGTTKTGQPRHCYSWRIDRPALRDWDPNSLRTGFQG